MTADLATLKTLLARVEAATNIDEQLAADIVALWFNEPWYPLAYGLGIRLTDDVAAIGAALVLVEKVLPGQGSVPSFAQLQRFPNYWKATVLSAVRLPVPYRWQHGKGQNGALAILAALLRAFIAQQEPAHD